MSNPYNNSSQTMGGTSNMGSDKSNKKTSHQVKLVKFNKKIK